MVLGLVNPLSTPLVNVLPTGCLILRHCCKLLQHSMLQICNILEAKTVPSFLTPDPCFMIHDPSFMTHDTVPCLPTQIKKLPPNRSPGESFR